MKAGDESTLKISLNQSLSPASWYLDEILQFADDFQLSMFRPLRAYSDEDKSW